MRPAHRLGALSLAAAACVVVVALLGEADAPRSDVGGAVQPPVEPAGTRVPAPDGSDAHGVRSPERAPTPQGRDIASPAPAARDSALARTAQPPAWTAARQFLWGRVLGTSGALAGARATLADSTGREVSSATADDDGRFQLPVRDSIEGALLRVTHGGYSPFESGPHSVAAGERRNVGVMRLVPAATLDGTVHDTDGEGLRAAVVRLHSVGLNRAELTAETDREGRFRILDAPTGSVRVHVSARGFAARSLGPLRVPQDSPLDIELTAGQSLDISVRTPDGAPVADAYVRLEAAGGRDAPVFQGRTDAEGNAPFDGVGAAHWTLQVSRDGFRSQRIADPDVQDGRVVVFLEPLPCLLGTVLAAEGDALPAGTRVAPFRADADGTWRDDPRVPGEPVAADGSFELCGLTPGNWVVRATAPEHAPVGSPTLTVQAGVAPHPARIRLIRGHTLEVRVAGPEQVASGASVDLYWGEAPASLLWRADSSPGPQPFANFQRTQTTDATGTAAFPNLAPGSYGVVVRHPDYYAAVAGPWHVGSGQRVVGVVTVDPGGAIRGTVHDPAGEPASGAWVAITWAESEDANPRPEAGSRMRIYVTGPDGTFRSAVLPPGLYSVVSLASAPDRPGTWSEESGPIAQVQVTVEGGLDVEADLYLSARELPTGGTARQ